MALAIAILAIIAGAATAVAFAIDATNARNEQKLRADEAVEARMSAERMNQYFLDLFANLRERDAAGTPTTAAEIVEFAVTSVESRPTQPGVERDLRETLAQALSELGDYNGALRQSERLLELTEPSGAPIERARVLIQVAVTSHLVGLYDKGSTHAKEALAALEGLPPEATIASRGVDSSTELSVIVLRARAYGSLATNVISLGRATEALAAADEALRLAEASGSAREVARALSTRARALSASGDAQQAAVSGRRAVEIARGLKLPVRDWIRHLLNTGPIQA